MVDAEVIRSESGVGVSCPLEVAAIGGFIAERQGKRAPPRQAQRLEWGSQTAIIMAKS